MTRRAFALAALAANLPAQRMSESVGAASDWFYQALELLSERSTKEQVERAVTCLRHALDQYASFADAHYYRYLCLQRLNREPAIQQSALSRAQQLNSEALRDRRDPFKLAVPKLYGDLAKVGQKWALVVGISRFQPDTGAEPLRFAKNDADAFAALLKDPAVGRFPAGNVTSLTNEQATTAAIKARLNRIATNAKPEDVVLVYLSTHGSSRSDDLRQVSYLYTYDTDVSSRDMIFGTALAMVDISSIISTRCMAQRTVVMFDTCHSGAGIATESLSSADFDRLKQGAGRYVVSSCEANQKSYEADGHGYFTSSLIGNLRARQGCIRMSDLFAQVQRDVSKKVMDTHRLPQRPIMAKSDDAAEIVLGAAVEGGPQACVAAG